MAIETLEEYLKRIKGTNSTNVETKIETIDDYAKRNNINIVNQGVQDILKEKELKKVYEQQKKTYQDSLKNYQSNIKSLNLNNSIKPFNNGTDKTIKTGNNILPTKDNLDKAKNNSKLINNSSEVQKSRENANSELNTLKKDRYDYDVVKENNNEVNFLDKTVGRVTSVIPDLLSMFDGTDRMYVDESGNKKRLASASELRNEHVSNSYDTAVGKFLGDSANTISKIAVSSVVPGGQALYWADMFTDSANQAANEGYTGTEGIAYATLSTASELITEKLLGGLSKITPGGTSDMSKTINKALSKAFKNDRLRSFISNALSEGTEEFVQEYIDLINRNVTLGENNKMDMQQFEKAIYSGLVGMASGGFFGAINVDVKTSNGKENAQNINNNVQNTPGINLNAPSEIQNNTLLSTGNTDRFQFKPTLSVKKNNFMASAYKYLGNSQGAIDFVNTINKVIDDKGYNVLFDDTITNVQGNSVNAQITPLENGEVEIKLNPNSDRAGEFLLVHEITHAIETDTMKQLVMDYASKNKEFNNALESLKQTYGTNDVSGEVLADISGQLLGNQEYINSLSTSSPNVFKRLYNAIISLANKITGNSRESLFIKDLKNKWETAYRTTTTEQSVSNLGGNTNFAMKNSKEYGNYWEVETGKDIFKNITGADLIKKAYNYILNGNDNFESIIDIIDGKEVKFRRISANEYTRGTNSTDLSSSEYNKKMRLAPSMDDLINNADITYHSPLVHKSTLFKEGFNNYQGKVKIDDTIFRYIVRIGKAKNDNIFYDISLENIGTEKGTFEVPSVNNTSLLKKEVPLTVNNIPQSNTNVKSDTLSAKYSMQESQNNTRELDNSSFSMDKNSKSLKQKQNEIIQNSNPAFNESSTWIRNAEDIKTFKETLEDSDYKEYYDNGDDFDESYSADMAKKAIETGKITVYSSYPIEQGIFVSPSRMEALSYSGTGKVYSKKVNLNDVAWIDPTQGQYANINQKYSQNNSTWQEHLEKNYKATGARTNFKDIKLLPKVEQKSAKPLPMLKDFNGKVVANKTIQEKIGNNELTINKLKQEKTDSIKNIDLKIKEKRDLYQSKKNKNTKLANVLQQQAITLENQKNSVITAYNHRIEQLEERNKKMHTKEYQIQEQRKTKSAQYREEAEDLIIGNVSTWKDKEAGIWYKRETFERNIRDIIPDKQVAKQVIDEYVTPIYNATANEEVFIKRYNDKIKSLNLTKEESMAVQMLGEGKYNGSKTIIDSENAKNILRDVNSNSDAKFGAQLYLDAIDFIENNKLDYNKIRDSVKTFRSIYDELFINVNKVLKEQGYKEMEYRKDYFPHFTKETADTKAGKLMEKMGWKKKDNSLPTDIACITDTFKPGKTYFKHLNRRYGNITEYNALEGFDNYIRGAADLVCLTEPIQKLRALENEIRYLHSEKGIQEKYEEVINSDLDADSKEQELNNILKNASTPLNNFVTELRSYTDNLANKKSELDRRTEYLFNRQVYSAMSNIESRVKANMVGANISSALTNFIPITQAWSQVSTKNLVKAMQLSLNNSIKSDGFSEQSEFLVNRTMKADRLFKTKLDNVSDKVGIVFEAVDSFTSNVVVRGKYLDNIEKGMSQTEAIKNANKFARGLMAARDKGSLPTIFNAKSPIVKLFSSFQLEVNNQYSYMLKDLPDDLKDEAGKRLVGAFIKMFLGAYIYNFFSEKITGRKSAFSPVDIIVDSTTTAMNKNLSTYDKLTNITQDVAGEIPFVGGLVGGGRLPISSALPSISTTVQSLLKLGDADKKKSAIKDIVKELSKPLFYIVPPFAGGQAKKTIEGLSMYANDIPGSYTTSGKLRFTTDKDVLSIGQAAIFGQYASKETRDYFDNGYTALTEKQQEELQTLNVPISKYREYQSVLKEWNKIKADKNSNGNAIAGTALAKSVYEMLNNDKEYSEKEINYFLSKLSDSDNPPTIEQLSQLDNDVDVYKYYFSLNKDSKDNFLTNITAFNFNQSKYVEYSKKIKEIDKKYSDMSKQIDNQQQKNALSNQKRSEIWNYIQKSNLTKTQKIILYGQSGYSITQYKSYMHDYINKLDITKAEKEKVWKELY